MEAERSPRGRGGRPEPSLTPNSAVLDAEHVDRPGEQQHGGDGRRADRHGPQGPEATAALAGEDASRAASPAPIRSTTTRAAGTKAARAGHQQAQAERRRAQARLRTATGPRPIARPMPGQQPRGGGVDEQAAPAAAGQGVVGHGDGGVDDQGGRPAQRASRAAGRPGRRRAARAASGPEHQHLLQQPGDGAEQDGAGHAEQGQGGRGGRRRCRGRRAATPTSTAATSGRCRRWCTGMVPDAGQRGGRSGPASRSRRMTHHAAHAPTRQPPPSPER